MIELDEGLPAEFRFAVREADLPALLTVLLAEERVARGALSVRFAGDELLHHLNRAYRGLDEPTDVLSFPLEEEAADGKEPFPAGPGALPVRELGDIAISVERAARQAAAAGRSLSRELRHLALHAALHLLGHDHEGSEQLRALRAREERLLGTDIHDGPLGGGED